MDFIIEYPIMDMEFIKMYEKNIFALSFMKSLFIYLSNVFVIFINSNEILIIGLLFSLIRL